MREIYVWEKNHIEECVNNELLANKDVLEVGGTLPKEFIEPLGCKSWTCIDYWYNKPYKEANYEILHGDISNIELNENSFDTIISTNCFEHLEDFEKSLKNMYRFLKPGGYLSALFGPIWSSDKGHHIWIHHEDGRTYTFNDGIIPPFGHLIYSESELKDLLKQRYDEKLVDKIIFQTFKAKEINRLFYEDYINILNSSDFIIEELRNWHTSVITYEPTRKLLRTKYPSRKFHTTSLKILLHKPL